MGQDGKEGAPWAKPGEGVDFSQTSFLVVDDMGTARASLRMTISTLGASRIDMAQDAADAMRKIKGRPYDIILCDYNLGDRRDGQQLLEELRTLSLIPLSTIFMMVTAESAYERVISVAELAPDDYLIKPFTGEALRSRLERLASKKSFFKPAYDAYERGAHRGAMAICDELLIAGDPAYRVDLLRFKAQLSLSLGDYEGARAIYEEVLSLRAIPWAKMGLGRALCHMEQFDQAAEVFEEVVSGSPNYAEAYDWLAKAKEHSGDLMGAQETLEVAVKRSPRILHRRKTLGRVAYANGDLETAQTSLEAAIAQSAGSALADPADFMNLGRIHIDKGSADQALKVADKARSTFGDSPSVRIQSAVLGSLAHGQTGNREEAQRCLEEALGCVDGSEGMDGRVACDLAKACIQLGRDEEGMAVIRTALLSKHDDSVFLDYAESLFKEMGKEAEVKAIVEEVRREVIGLNNKAVSLAKSGDLEGAVRLFVESVSRYAGNETITLNAVRAIIVWMRKDGWKDDYARLARHYLAEAKKSNASNPKAISLADDLSVLAKDRGVVGW